MYKYINKYTCCKRLGIKGKAIGQKHAKTYTSIQNITYNIKPKYH